VHWFRDDWGLFEHERMDDPRAKDLLAEILDDGDIVRQSFRPAEAGGMDALGDWQKLRDELMYQNRFFPEVEIDFDRLGELLSTSKSVRMKCPQCGTGRGFKRETRPSPPPIWARLPNGPPLMAAPIRRNSISLLGIHAATAVSEIRPHTGETACVAEFTTPPDLKVVDLRRPRKTVSPFLLPDATDIVRMRSDLPFLERLGEELTRPVLLMPPPSTYTPSQYLCEFIKKSGYDGVVYRSSVSDGINLALQPSRLWSAT